MWQVIMVYDTLGGEPRPTNKDTLQQPMYLPKLRIGIDVKLLTILYLMQ